MIEAREYGFIPPGKEELQASFDAGYVFGGIGGDAHMEEPLNPLCNWLQSVPPNESQFNRFLDSYGCTLFGTFNAIETLAKFKWNEAWDKAERFTGAFADMTPRGNNPHKVADTIHSFGLIDDRFMPLGDASSFDELWDTEKAEKFKDLGESWKRWYDFRHWWAKQEEIPDALGFSPLGVSVHAWVQDSDGLFYRPEGAKDTHWTCLVNAQLGGYEKENFFEVFDSYPPYIKRLRGDYTFPFIKRYRLEKLSNVSCWDKIIRFFS